MIGEGMRVRFVPVVVNSGVMTPQEKKRVMVTGIVRYINWKHKYFTAEYDCAGTKQHESFRFHDIGKDVTICG